MDDELLIEETGEERLLNVLGFCYQLGEGRLINVFGFCYQLAGQLLLTDEGTEGQRERLTNLLLDTLSDPQQYEVDVLERLQKMAVKP